MRLVSRSRAPCCRTVLNNCGTASGPSARSRMPIVGPATGTASDPRPRPPGSGARACKRIKSRNCRAPQSPEFVTHRDSRSSAMRRPWRASRNSAAARSPLRCRHAPSRRSIATPSPRPTVHLPAGRPRAARGWWTCRRRRRRSLRRVVRPAQQLDHPQQVRPCSVASKPMPAHAMAAAIRNPGAVCARQISRIALHMQSGRQRAFCLAVRIRGNAPDQPDGLPLLAHAHTRRRRA